MAQPENRHRWRTAAVCAAALVAVAFSSAQLTAVSADAVADETPSTRSTPRLIDTSDKDAVRAAYLNTLLPALDTPTGWTGSTSSCTVGRESKASREATLTAVNFYRSLTGIGPVTLDGTRSDKALAAALMMDAADSLSHAPPTSWPCYSSRGAEAAGRSNLYWSSCCSGAVAVPGYVIDAGSSNQAVGHRRWLLDPEISVIGTGSTAQANAIWVVPEASDSNTSGPKWIAWPAPGFVPMPLAVGLSASGRQKTLGRWSLSTRSTLNADFTNAAVKATLANGTRLDVTIESRQANSFRYGSAIVWSFQKPSGGFSLSRSTKVRIRVSGIVVGGQSVTRSYSVKLFPAFTPEAPRASVDATDDTLAVSWDAAKARGVNVTGYTVKVYSDNPYTSEPVRTLELDATARSVDVSIPGGTAYYAFVFADSEAGQSPPPASATSKYVP